MLVCRSKAVVFAALCWSLGSLGEAGRERVSYAELHWTIPERL